MPAPEPDAVAITLDVDWAPDFMIDGAALLLTERGVRATWFVTHRSAAVERLADNPLFELGLHPNFRPGSTHGDSWKAVLAHCAELVPGAAAMRTHSLVQSTPLLERVVAETEVWIDCSLYLPHATGVRPLEHWSPAGRLVRIPFVWEDDLEMSRPAPAWSPDGLPRAGGLKVLDFHPVHVFLNSVAMDGYEALKRAAPLSDVDEAMARRFANGAGPGARHMFVAAIDRLAEEGGGTTMSALAAASA